MVRHPPDMLITTPESLYLMLTSQAREIFARRRGGDRRRDPRRRADQARRAPRAHARAARRGRPGRDVQRIGLSATQNPLEEVGRFLVGPKRDVHGRRRRRAQAARPQDPRAGRVDGRARAATDARARPVRRAARRRASRSGRRSTPSCSSWSREHRSTIVFVNNRRAAERLALRLNELRRASDDRPRPPRLARARGAPGVEEHAQGRRAAVPGRDLSLELGIDMGAVDLVLQVESPKSVAARAAAHRPRRPRRRRRRRKGASSPSSAPTCSSARSSPSACARARSRPTVVPRNPLDVLAQQIVAMAAAADEEPVRVDELHALVTRTHSYAELSRELLENVLDMLDGRYPSRGVRRAAPAHRLGPRRRARSARARARARWRSPTPARSPTAGCSPSTSPTAAASASSTRRWSTRRGPARRSCSAPRPGGSRRSRATA